ncbi:MAG TPA: hypothetical protein VHT24_10580, partial [Pseudacidobacterium sp.]|nr:hypothetical protein [Pseudacidobacterium sp.]
MKLSPTLGADNFFLVPQMLDLCIAGDNRYKGCGKEDPNINVENARVNLNEIAARIDQLRSQHYPDELKPVVAYVIAIQEFSLERGARELDYLLNGDEAALERKIGLVDPHIECQHLLERIRDTNDPANLDKMARFDWMNCVW